MGQMRTGPAPPQNQRPASAYPGSIPQPRTSQDAGAGQHPGTNTGDVRAQDMLPPPSSPSVANGSRPSSAAFFSARAVEMLRDNPQSYTAPQFDPHAESPSIRKTAGVDHTKSVPISKPMIAGASPSANNNNRDFVNPSADMHRKIGAPGGNAVGSPMGRGQTTSSYRPLTRPNIDPRTAAAGTNGAVPPPNRGAPAQNMNGKRPPLSDVTNGAAVPGGSGPAPNFGAGDMKRPKFDGDMHPGQQQQPQNPPQQPPQP